MGRIEHVSMRTKGMCIITSPIILSNYSFFFTNYLKQSSERKN